MSALPYGMTDRDPRGMSIDARRKEIGDIGEGIVLEWMLAGGHPARLSSNAYDDEKDIVIEVDGTQWLVEVKTQVPYYKLNMMTVKDRQLRKCQMANELIFLSIPSNGEPNSVAYRANDEPGARRFLAYRSQGREMLGMSINDTTPIFRVPREDPRIARLLAITLSEVGK